MSTNVLVTYASRAGSTVGIAETIGRTLAEQGMTVEVHPMKAVHDLTPYGAVVAGSAIQSHQWLPEAMEFLRNHQAQLQQKPFAAFLVCMALAMNTTPAQQQKQAEVGTWLAPVRALVPPISEGLFAGGLDIARLPSFSERLQCRLSVLLGEWKEGDYRDWNAIRGWAQVLAIRLQPEPSSI